MLSLRREMLSLRREMLSLRREMLSLRREMLSLRREMPSLRREMLSLRREMLSFSGNPVFFFLLDSSRVIFMDILFVKFLDEQKYFCPMLFIRDVIERHFRVSWNVLKSMF